MKGVLGSFKDIIRRAIRAAGYDLVDLKNKASHEVEILEKACDPYEDIKTLVRTNQPLVVFDVGANSGQSIRKLKNVFPTSKIHAFEPSPTVFETLETNSRIYEGVFLNNKGVGSRDGVLRFHENVCSDMSSFLEPDEFAWGNVVSSKSLPMVTLDTYCKEAGVHDISLLKIDTQGLDFDVLMGALNLIKERRIQLILLEIIFSKMYKGTPAYHKIFEFLNSNGYELVSLYNFHRQNGVLSWADGLFVCRVRN